MNRSDTYDGTGEPEGLPAPLAAELRALADTACPPDVVAAALAAARQTAPPTPDTGRGGRPAPDRAPRRGAWAGRRWAPVALVALGALVVAVVALRGGAEDAQPPQVAQVEPTAPPPAREGGVAETSTSATPPPASSPLPRGDGHRASDGASQSEGLASRRPARSTPPRPAPDGAAPSPTPPRPAAGGVAAPADPSADAAPPLAEAAGGGADAPTEAEVEAAQRDLELAFALVADVQRRADRALRPADVLQTLDTALPHLAP